MSPQSEYMKRLVINYRYGQNISHSKLQIASIIKESMRFNTRLVGGDSVHNVLVVYEKFTL